MRLEKLMKSKQNGFSLIEVIVAVALMISIATVGLGMILGSYGSLRLGEEQSKATFYSQQGIEAVRSMKNRSWDDFIDFPVCMSGCGVENDGSQWQWSSSPSQLDKYSRIVELEDVYRDSNNDIVSSGGEIDPDTKKITSKVSWSFVPTRNNVVESTTYLTNFRKIINVVSGNWSNVIQPAILNFLSSENSLKVQTVGDYAYAIRSTGSQRLSIVNISDSANPVLVGQLGTQVQNPNNIFVSGNYAYLTGTQNTNELIIADVSNPSSPSVAGSFNTPGSGDGQSIFVTGNTGYMIISSQGSNPTFYVLNLTNKSSVSQMAGIAVANSPREIVVDGNYAYVSTTSNSRELEVININNPSAPSIVGFLNLPSNDDAITISKIDDYLFIGQGSNLRIINVSNPVSPILTSTLAMGGTINDISINHYVDGQYLFIATSNSAREFQVVDVSNPSTPSVIGFYDVLGNNPLLGVAYNEGLNLAVGVGSSNDEEFVIFAPN
jgi:prepilin-type N-terminal cleavage/methylation domain-containing protein